MNFGNWFHNVGVEDLKGHAAKVWYLTFGVCSMVPVLFDHILSHVLHFKLIRSCKYFGAMPVMHVNVVIRILCSHNVFLSCCQEPKRMYSVLSGFSFRHIVAIQCFSWVNASSRPILILYPCTLLPALEWLHVEWSSANAASVMELSIWSLTSEQ